MHINRFEEHSNENLSAFDIISYIIIAWSLYKFLKGILHRIGNSIVRNEVQTILDKLLKKQQLSVTEFNDRFFIKLDDMDDIRLIKEKKALILGDIKIHLTDDEYDSFLKLISIKKDSESTLQKKFKSLI